jgi:hypothetical protein
MIDYSKIQTRSDGTVRAMFLIHLKLACKKMFKFDFAKNFKTTFADHNMEKMLTSTTLSQKSKIEYVHFLKAFLSWTKLTINGPLTGPKLTLVHWFRHSSDP